MPHTHTRGFPGWVGVQAQASEVATLFATSYWALVSFIIYIYALHFLQWAQLELTGPWLPHARVIIPIALRSSPGQREGEWAKVIQNHPVNFRVQWRFGHSCPISQCNYCTSVALHNTFNILEIEVLKPRNSQFMHVEKWGMDTIITWLHQTTS